MPNHDLKHLTLQANAAVLEVAVFLRQEATRVQPGQRSHR